MLEITCQATEVRVVAVESVWVIRAYDKLSGVIINIPLTAVALSGLIAEAALAG